MELRIGRTQFHMHPLMVLFPILGHALGMQGETALFLLSLSVHELSHLAASKACGIHISRISLMPFGGTAQMANPYALSPARLCITAAAGPISNFALIVIGGAMAHWRIIPSDTALTFLKINLLLMLFNLLPALPLDGGRILYACLAPCLGRTNALKTGLYAGRVLSAMLIALCLYIRLTRGIFNISFLFAAIFILTSGPNERRALGDIRIQTILNEMKPLTQPVPANLWAVNASCPSKAALRAASPDAVTMYAVYDGSRLKGFTDDRQLLEHILNTNEGTSVGDALISNIQ